jgi:hypothetical protein
MSENTPAQPLDLALIKAKMEVDKYCDCPKCQDMRDLVTEVERLRSRPEDQGEAALTDAERVVLLRDQMRKIGEAAAKETDRADRAEAKLRALESPQFKGDGEPSEAEGREDAPGEREELAWEPHARALRDVMERGGIEVVCLGPRWEAKFHDLHDPEGKDPE